MSAATAQVRPVESLTLAVLLCPRDELPIWPLPCAQWAQPSVNGYSHEAYAQQAVSTVQPPPPGVAVADAPPPPPPDAAQQPPVPPSDPAQGTVRSNHPLKCTQPVSHHEQPLLHHDLVHEDPHPHFRCFPILSYVPGKNQR